MGYCGQCKCFVTCVVHVENEGRHDDREGHREGRQWQYFPDDARRRGHCHVRSFYRCYRYFRCAILSGRWVLALASVGVFRFREVSREFHNKFVHRHNAASDQQQLRTIKSLRRCSRKRSGDLPIVKWYFFTFVTVAFTLLICTYL